MKNQSKGKKLPLKKINISKLDNKKNLTSIMGGKPLASGFNAGRTTCTS